MTWISQGLLDGGTVTSFVQVFGLKIYASIAADVFCRLHNDKYTKFQPCENCGLRACIDSLVTREKFGIRERKVNFFKRLDL